MAAHSQFLTPPAALKGSDMKENIFSGEHLPFMLCQMPPQQRTHKPAATEIQGGNASEQRAGAKAPFTVALRHPWQSSLEEFLPAGPAGLGQAPPLGADSSVGMGEG